MRSRKKGASCLVGANVDFVYLDYADITRDPLGNHSVENVDQLRDAAASYNLTRGFQRLVPGGFETIWLAKPKLNKAAVVPVSS
jgi:hypothetical protein